MAEGGFQKCMPIELKLEGGKVDDPRDPGGRTNQGIIQRVYDAYRRRAGRPVQDVYLISPTERDDIYRTQYWVPIHGDELPTGVDLVVLDGAVNSGVSQSIKWLQRAVGVSDDGFIGSVTLDAVENYGDDDELVAKIIEQREAFLRHLKTFKTFGNGWLSRTAMIEQSGQAWATGSVGPLVEHIPDANKKTNVEDVKTAPPKGVADAATGIGIGSGGIGAVVQTLQEQLTPYSYAGGWITKLVIALVVVGAVLTIGGLAWRFYSNWKKDKLAASGAAS